MHSITGEQITNNDGEESEDEGSNLLSPILIANHALTESRHIHPHCIHLMTMWNTFIHTNHLNEDNNPLKIHLLLLRFIASNSQTIQSEDLSSELMLFLTTFVMYGEISLESFTSIWIEFITLI